MKKASKASPNLYLRREREQRYWSREYVAEQIKTDAKTVGRWERGITSPSPYFRQALCQLFGKSAAELGLLQQKGRDKKQDEQSDQEDNTRTNEESREESKREDNKDSSAVDSSQTIWNVPYRRNPFFTGREQVLAELHQTLNEGSLAALAHPKALSGLSGIGKTQTAIEYAYRYRQEYQAVLWVRADTREVLVSDFVAIADLLQLPEKDEQDQSRIIASVLQWLNKHNSWLLILDNADDLTLVRDFIPTLGEGHVVLTTCAQLTGTTAQHVEMEKMEPGVGALFLLRRAGLLTTHDTLDSASAVDRSAAIHIAITLDGLPLALDQAGAYIEETSCGLSGYLERYRQRGADLLKMRGKSVWDHPEAVATTWSLSFENVAQANSAAVDLLRLCAFLHPDAIPEEILTEGASAFIPTLAHMANDVFALDVAIEELRKFSLLRRNPRTKTLSVHRLVQAVLRDRMDEQTRRYWVEQTVKIVNRVFPEVSFDTWPQCQRCIPHAQTCAALVEQWNMAFEEAAQLFKRAGLYLHERTQYKEAQVLLNQALAIHERTLGPEHLNVADSINSLASLYHDQGEYEFALPLYQRAFTIRERILGPDHLIVADSLSNIALFYDYHRKYAQSEQFYKRALAIYERELGPLHSEVAQNLNGLALLYEHEGKYAEAEPLYQRAIEIREQVLGENHPLVAESLNNLALLYYFQGKYTQGQLLAERALRIREKTLGPDHLAVTEGLNVIAKQYRAQGKYEQAEPLYLRALAIRERLLGKDHVRQTVLLNNIAELYCDQGRYEEAEQHIHHALVLCENALGLEHPRMAMLLNTQAEIYRDQKKYVQAEQSCRRALNIEEKALLPDDPDLAATLTILAELMYGQGKYEQAEQFCHRALAIHEKSLGPEHPDIATCLNILSLLYEIQDEWDTCPPDRVPARGASSFPECAAPTEAERLYQRALAILEKFLGTEHPAIAKILHMHAELYETRGEFVKAEEFCHRALAIREKALRPDHPFLLQSRNMSVIHREHGRESGIRV